MRKQPIPVLAEGGKGLSAGTIVSVALLSRPARHDCPVVVIVEEAGKVENFLATNLLRAGAGYENRSMSEESFPDLVIEEWLETLGFALLADWDVLAFLYRHRISLVSAEQIARLVGYPSSVVGDVLDRLESQKLVLRSRASLGVRLYQFVVPTAPSDEAVRELMSVAETRAGRLRLTAGLRQRASRAKIVDGDNLHLVKGNKAWRTAV